MWLKSLIVSFSPKKFRILFSHQIFSIGNNYFFQVLFGVCLCTVQCLNLVEMVPNSSEENFIQTSASNSNSDNVEQQFELETYRKYILQLSEALKSCYDQNTVSSHPLSIVLSKNAQKSKFFFTYFHNNSNISIFSKFIEKYRYILT